MVSRERVLVVAFLAVGGCSLAYWGYKTQIASRLEEAETAAARARDSASRKKEEVVESRAAQLELARWEKLSLSADPNTAIPQYQAFLLDLLEQSGFSEPTITPRSAAMREETYWRLPFDVQAQGSMQSLITFVDAFYRTQVLHKLGRLSMTPIERNGQSELDLHFGVEALALTTDASSALEEEHAESENSMPPAESSSSQPFSQLLANNLLMRQGIGPSARPEFVAAQVYLTGTIVKVDRPEALFFNRATGESFVRHLGDRLAVGDVRGELVEIGLSQVLFSAGDQWWTLDLGEHLGRRRPITDAELLTRALDAPVPEVTLAPP